SAVAAGLVILAAVWMWSADRGTRQELASTTAKVRQLERENLALRRRTSGEGEQVAALSAPRLNTPVLDLFPAGAVARSANSPTTNRIIAPRAGPYTLILNG